MSVSTPDDASAFFVEIVEPTVREFLADWQSVRRGLLAALVLSHMADHLFWSRQPIRTLHQTEGKWREHLKGQIDDFALVADVANAAKHARLTKGKPTLRTSKDVGTGAVGWDEARWDEARWDGPEQVLVTTHSRGRRTLEGPVRSVFMYWQSVV